MNIIKKYGAILVFAIIILLLYFRSHNYQEKARDSGRFTIGCITGQSPGRPDPYLVFTYTVKGKKITAETSTYNRSLVGCRFYVVFLEKNLDDGEILLYYPVPNDIKDAPSEGWSKLPDVDKRMRDSLNLYRYAERSNKYLRKENWR